MNERPDKRPTTQEAGPKHPAAEPIELLGELQRPRFKPWLKLIAGIVCFCFLFLELEIPYLLSPRKARAQSEGRLVPKIPDVTPPLAGERHFDLPAGDITLSSGEYTRVTPSRSTITEILKSFWLKRRREEVLKKMEEFQGEKNIQESIFKLAKRLERIGFDVFETIKFIEQMIKMAQGFTFGAASAIPVSGAYFNYIRRPHDITYSRNDKDGRLIEINVVYQDLIGGLSNEHTLISYNSNNLPLGMIITRTSWTGIATRIVRTGMKWLAGSMYFGLNRPGRSYRSLTDYNEVTYHPEGYETNKDVHIDYFPDKPWLPRESLTRSIDSRYPQLEIIRRIIYDEYKDDNPRLPTKMTVITTEIGRDESGSIVHEKTTVSEKWDMEYEIFTNGGDGFSDIFPVLIAYKERATDERGNVSYNYFSATVNEFALYTAWTMRTIALGVETITTFLGRYDASGRRTYASYIRRRSDKDLVEKTEQFFLEYDEFDRVTRERKVRTLTDPTGGVLNRKIITEIFRFWLTTDLYIEVSKVIDTINPAIVKYVIKVSPILDKIKRETNPADITIKVNRNEVGEDEINRLDELLLLKFDLREMEKTKCKIDDGGLLAGGIPYGDDGLIAGGIPYGDDGLIAGERVDIEKKIEEGKKFLKELAAVLITRNEALMRVIDELLEKKAPQVEALKESVKSAKELIHKLEDISALFDNPAFKEALVEFVASAAKLIGDAVTKDSSLVPRYLLFDPSFVKQVKANLKDVVKGLKIANLTTMAKLLNRYGLYDALELTDRKVLDDFLKNNPNPTENEWLSFLEKNQALVTYLRLTSQEDIQKVVNDPDLGEEIILQAAATDPRIIQNYAKTKEGSQALAKFLSDKDTVFALHNILKKNSQSPKVKTLLDQIPELAKLDTAIGVLEALIAKYEGIVKDLNDSLNTYIQEEVLPNFEGKIPAEAVKAKLSLGEHASVVVSETLNKAFDILGEIKKSLTIATSTLTALFNVEVKEILEWNNFGHPTVDITVDHVFGRGANKELMNSTEAAYNFGTIYFQNSALPVLQNVITVDSASPGRFKYKQKTFEYGPLLMECFKKVVDTVLGIDSTGLLSLYYKTTEEKKVHQRDIQGQVMHESRVEVDKNGNRKETDRRYGPYSELGFPTLHTGTEMLIIDGEEVTFENRETGVIYDKDGRKIEYTILGTATDRDLAIRDEFTKISYLNGKINGYRRKYRIGRIDTSGNFIEFYHILIERLFTIHRQNGEEIGLERVTDCRKTGELTYRIVYSGSKNELGEIINPATFTITVAPNADQKLIQQKLEELIRNGTIESLLILRDEQDRSILEKILKKNYEIEALIKENLNLTDELLTGLAKLRELINDNPSIKNAFINYIGTNPDKFSDFLFKNSALVGMFARQVDSFLEELRSNPTLVTQLSIVHFATMAELLSDYLELFDSLEVDSAARDKFLKRYPDLASLSRDERIKKIKAFLETRQAGKLTITDQKIITKILTNNAYSKVIEEASLTDSSTLKNFAETSAGAEAVVKFLLANTHMPQDFLNAHRDDIESFGGATLLNQVDQNQAKVKRIDANAVKIVMIRDAADHLITSMLGGVQNPAKEIAKEIKKLLGLENVNVKVEEKNTQVSTLGHQQRLFKLVSDSATDEYKITSQEVYTTDKFERPVRGANTVVEIGLSKDGKITNLTTVKLFNGTKYSSNTKKITEQFCLEGSSDKPAIVMSTTKRTTYDSYLEEAVGSESKVELGVSDKKISYYTTGSKRTDILGLDSELKPTNKLIVTTDKYGNKEKTSQSFVDGAAPGDGAHPTIYFDQYGRVLRAIERVPQPNGYILVDSLFDPNVAGLGYNDRGLPVGYNERERNYNYKGELTGSEYREVRNIEYNWAGDEISSNRNIRKYDECGNLIARMVRNTLQRLFDSFRRVIEEVLRTIDTNGNIFTVIRNYTYNKLNQFLKRREVKLDKEGNVSGQETETKGYSALGLETELHIHNFGSSGEEYNQHLSKIKYNSLGQRSEYCQEWDNYQGGGLAYLEPISAVLDGDGQWNQPNLYNGYYGYGGWWGWWQRRGGLNAKRDHMAEYNGRMKGKVYNIRYDPAGNLICQEEDGETDNGTFTREVFNTYNIRGDITESTELIQQLLKSGDKITSRIDYFGNYVKGLLDNWKKITSMRVERQTTVRLWDGRSGHHWWGSLFGGSRLIPHKVTIVKTYQKEEKGRYTYNRDKARVIESTVDISVKENEEWTVQRRLPKWRKLFWWFYRGRSPPEPKIYKNVYNNWITKSTRTTYNYDPISGLVSGLKITEAKKNSTGDITEDRNIAYEYDNDKRVEKTSVVTHRYGKVNNNEIENTKKTTTTVLERTDDLYKRPKKVRVQETNAYGKEAEWIETREYYPPDHKFAFKLKAYKRNYVYAPDHEWQPEDPIYVNVYEIEYDIHGNIKSSRTKSLTLTGQPAKNTRQPIKVTIPDFASLVFRGWYGYWGWWYWHRHWYLNEASSGELALLSQLGVQIPDGAKVLRSGNGLYLFIPSYPNQRPTQNNTKLIAAYYAGALFSVDEDKSPLKAIKDNTIYTPNSDDLFVSEDGNVLYLPSQPTDLRLATSDEIALLKDAGIDLPDGAGLYYSAKEKAFYVVDSGQGTATLTLRAVAAERPEGGLFIYSPSGGIRFIYENGELRVPGPKEIYPFITKKGESRRYEIKYKRNRLGEYLAISWKGESETHYSEPYWKSFMSKGKKPRPYKRKVIWEKDTSTVSHVKYDLAGRMISWWSKSSGRSYFPGGGSKSTGGGSGSRVRRLSFNKEEDVTYQVISGSGTTEYHTYIYNAVGRLIKLIVRGRAKRTRWGYYISYEPGPNYGLMLGWYFKVKKKKRSRFKRIFGSVLKIVVNIITLIIPKIGLALRALLSTVLNQAINLAMGGEFDLLNSALSFVAQYISFELFYGDINLEGKSLLQAAAQDKGMTVGQYITYRLVSETAAVVAATFVSDALGDSSPFLSSLLSSVAYSVVGGLVGAAITPGKFGEALRVEFNRKNFLIPVALSVPLAAIDEVATKKMEKAAESGKKAKNRFAWINFFQSIARTFTQYYLGNFLKLLLMILESKVVDYLGGKALEWTDPETGWKYKYRNFWTILMRRPSEIRDKEGNLIYFNSEGYSTMEAAKYLAGLWKDGYLDKWKNTTGAMNKELPAILNGIKEGLISAKLITLNQRRIAITGMEITTETLKWMKKNAKTIYSALTIAAAKFFKGKSLEDVVKKLGKLEANLIMAADGMTSHVEIYIDKRAAEKAGLEAKYQKLLEKKGVKAFVIRAYEGRAAHGVLMKDGVTREDIGKVAAELGAAKKDVEQILKDLEKVQRSNKLNGVKLIMENGKLTLGEAHLALSNIDRKTKKGEHLYRSVKLLSAARHISIQDVVITSTPDGIVDYFDGKLGFKLLSDRPNQSQIFIFPNKKGKAIYVRDDNLIYVADASKGSVVKRGKRPVAIVVDGKVYTTITYKQLLELQLFELKHTGKPLPDLEQQSGEEVMKAIEQFPSWIRPSLYMYYQAPRLAVLGSEVVTAPEFYRKYGQERADLTEKLDMRWSYLYFPGSTVVKSIISQKEGLLYNRLMQPVDKFSKSAQDEIKELFKKYKIEKKAKVSALVHVKTRELLYKGSVRGTEIFVWKEFKDGKPVPGTGAKVTDAVGRQALTAKELGKVPYYNPDAEYSLAGMLSTGQVSVFCRVLGDREGLILIMSPLKKDRVMWLVMEKPEGPILEEKPTPEGKPILAYVSDSTGTVTIFKRNKDGYLVAIDGPGKFETIKVKDLKTGKYVEKSTSRRRVLLPWGGDIGLSLVNGEDRSDLEKLGIKLKKDENVYHHAPTGILSKKEGKGHVAIAFRDLVTETAKYKLRIPKGAKFTAAITEITKKEQKEIVFRLAIQPKKGELPEKDGPPVPKITAVLKDNKVYEVMKNGEWPKAVKELMRDYKDARKLVKKWHQTLKKGDQEEINRLYKQQQRVTGWKQRFFDVLQTPWVFDQGIDPRYRKQTLFTWGLQMRDHRPYAYNMFQRLIHDPGFHHRIRNNVGYVMRKMWRPAGIDTTRFPDFAKWQRWITPPAPTLGKPVDPKTKIPKY